MGLRLRMEVLVMMDKRGEKGGGAVAGCKERDVGDEEG